MNNKLFTDAKPIDLFACLNSEEKARADYKGMIASAILEKRLELGFSQAEFASYLHVSQSTISKWESGDCNFSLDKLAHPLSLLGLTIRITSEPEFDFEKIHCEGYDLIESRTPGTWSSFPSYVKTWNAPIFAPTVNLCSHYKISTT